jgi:hypothetical protein
MLLLPIESENGDSKRYKGERIEDKRPTVEIGAI